MTEGRPTSPGTTVVVGWLLIALVNACFIVMEPLPPGGVSVRIAHLLFDVGQTLGAGLLCSVAVNAFQRWAPRRRLAGLNVVAALSVIIGLVVLPGDLKGFTAWLVGPGRSRVWVWLVSAACSLVIPAAMLAGRIFRRPKLRWLAFGSGAALATANNALLPGDYPGIHLVVSLAAATIAASSLIGAIVPERVHKMRDAVPKNARRVALGIVVVAALLAVVIQPSHRVRAQMSRIDGATISRLVVRGHALVSSLFLSDSVAEARGQWLKSRKDAPDVAPSNLGLVDSDQLIVVMITIDSMRAELMTDPKYAARLPRLWALAAESTYFSQMESTGAGTVATYSQIFTGKHMFQLKWKQSQPTPLMPKTQPMIHEDESVRFTELLSAAGIRTVTFANYAPLHPETGMLRGIDEATFVYPESDDQMFALAKETIDASVERIEKHDGGRMFLFVHLIDPHRPYDAAGDQGNKFDNYVAEIALCGVAIERVIRALKEHGFWERTVFISGSDHGEGFSKHKGLRAHNTHLYEEVIHVPMFFRVPRLEGKVIDTMVSAMDLGPTILDLFGLQTPGEYMGQSLVPALAGEGVNLSRPILASTLKRFRKTALYQPPFKLIVNDRNKTAEVYDLSKDPDERDNLADTMADEMLKDLNALRSVHRPH
ncbi:MAG: sulfatase [Polyangiales bacterium]